MTEHNCKKDKEFQEVYLFIGRVTEALDNIKDDVNGLHIKARANADLLKKIGETTSNLKIRVAFISSAVGAGLALFMKYVSGLM